MATAFGRTLTNVTRARVSMRSLVSIVKKRTVVRARDLYRSGIHREALSRALRRGLFLKIGRGLYACKDFSADFERQIMLAMAIDSKAKKPVASDPRLRFVRFSGQALTLGVENTRIEGVPVRIYSAAKTIADCLKYRRKIGGNLAVKVLRESIDRRKCSEQRLRHFARICRIRKLVHAAYSLVARA